MRIKFAGTIILMIMIFTDVFARDVHEYTLSTQETTTLVKKPWYETIQLRGYAQLRYNGLFETNPNNRQQGSLLRMQAQVNF